VGEYSRQSTIFPCRHISDNIFHMPGRCAVCRMPVNKIENSLRIFNTDTIFCCRECMDYYKVMLGQLKVVWDER